MAVELRRFPGVLREHKEKRLPRGLHDCLGVLGTEDNVPEYYQQQEEQEKLAKSETYAIRISNMVLFAAKVYASLRSGSLAIIASTLDSLLGLLSGFILWFTTFSMQTPNPYQYPIGKKRMQLLSLK